MGFDPYEDLKFYLLALVVFAATALAVVTCSTVTRRLQIGSPAAERCASFCGAFGERAVGNNPDTFPLECICLDRKQSKNIRIIRP